MPEQFRSGGEECCAHFREWRRSWYKAWMILAPVRATLADHPAIRECLESHGFRGTSANRFSNGRAAVRFEGSNLVAEPGDGSRTWRSDLGAAPPEAVVELLNVVLSMTPFLSQTELDRRAERTYVARIALDRIVEVLREGPETHSGRELRRFLWSLFNGHHVLNLWRLRDELDPQRNAWVTEVFTAWMHGDVEDDSLRRALEDSGEMERWDAVRLRTAERGRLDGALHALDEILRSTAPGPAHAALTRARGLLRQVGQPGSEEGRSDSELGS